MVLLGKRLLTLGLLPLFLLMAVASAPPVVAASQTCTTHSASHTIHDPDGTTAVVTQTVTRCTDPADDVYQNMSVSTYLVKYGSWGNWLFTWGISEQWTVDLTTSTITYFQNPPMQFFSQCCHNPDGSALFFVFSSSTSASQSDSQDIQASGSAWVWVNIFTCSIINPGLCWPQPYPYDSVSCNANIHLTSPSGGCSG